MKSSLIIILPYNLTNSKIASFIDIFSNSNTGDRISYLCKSTEIVINSERDHKIFSARFKNRRNRVKLNELGFINLGI